MGMQIERSNLIGVKALVDDLIPRLITAGFVLKSGTGGVYNPAQDNGMAVLEAGPTVDPLNTGGSAEPWRIKIFADSDLSMKMYAGTANQISDTGVVSKLEASGFAGAAADPESAGVLGTDVSPAGEMAGQKFFSMKGFTDLANIGSYPLSYQLSISERGIALFVWTNSQDTQGNRFSWAVIQRAVNHQTGAMVAVGKTPVFCVYYTALSPQANIQKFVVREKDIHKPTRNVSATTHTEDSKAIINPMNQVSIGEDNKYVVQFPNNLNTPRYSYTDELDLIAFTSADVVSQFAEVPVRVYGETSDRVYRAMLANGPNNTGARILMLVNGGGIAP